MSKQLSKIPLFSAFKQQFSHQKGLLEGLNIECQEHIAITRSILILKMAVCVLKIPTFVR